MRTEFDEVDLGSLAAPGALLLPPVMILAAPSRAGAGTPVFGRCFEVEAAAFASILSRSIFRSAVAASGGEGDGGRDAEYGAKVAESENGRCTLASTTQFRAKLR